MRLDSTTFWSIDIFWFGSNCNQNNVFPLQLTHENAEIIILHCKLYAHTEPCRGKTSSIWLFWRYFCWEWLKCRPKQKYVFSTKKKTTYKKHFSFIVIAHKIYSTTDSNRFRLFLNRLNIESMIDFIWKPMQTTGHNKCRFLFWL